MTRTALLAVLLFAAPAFAGTPALVTLSQGAVTLPDGTKPTAPFVLAEGQSLTLAEGEPACTDAPVRRGDGADKHNHQHH